MVTYYGLKALGGWDKLREICGSEMFNLWKPVVPAWCRRYMGSGKRSGKRGMVFQ